MFARTLTILLALAALAGAQNSQLTLNSFINDNHVLNFALTLENFEAELYRRAVASFTPTSFANAGYNLTAYNYLTTVAAQEAVHAAAINSTLISRGWPPVQPCTYNFPANTFTDINTFLTFTATVEQIGVSAYDGAVPYVSDPSLLEFAATVATVEGRHSAYLYQLVNQTFSPSALEAALTPGQVVPLVARYLGNCPTTVQQTGYNGTVNATSTSLVLPQPANLTRQLDPTFATATSPVVNISTTGQLNDYRVLNYALTALTFVDNFLNYSLAGYNTTNPPVNASSLAAAGYDPSVLNGLFTILSQNTAQIAAVRMMINARGLTPLEPCVYSFPAVVTNVSIFWQLATTFENVSVMAFDGGIRAISDSSIAAAAAAIATVEGRHSAFLNNASGLYSPFPAAYDGTLTPPATKSMLAPYIISCPTAIVESISQQPVTSLNFTLPTYLNYFAQNAQTVAGQTPGTPYTVIPAVTTPSTSSTTTTSTTSTSAGTTSSQRANDAVKTPTNWMLIVAVSAVAAVLSF